MEEDLGHLEVLVSNAGVVNPPRLIKEGGMEVSSPNPPTPSSGAPSSLSM